MEWSGVEHAWTITLPTFHEATLILLVVNASYGSTLPTHWYLTLSVTVRCTTSATNRWYQLVRTYVHPDITFRQHVSMLDPHLNVQPRRPSTHAKRSTQRIDVEGGRIDAHNPRHTNTAPSESRAHVLLTCQCRARTNRATGLRVRPPPSIGLLLWYCCIYTPPRVWS